MGTVLSIIGFCVVIRFCFRHRRIVMDKQVLRASVNNLREGITKRWSSAFMHRELDDIVHNVLGEPEMENLDDNLTQHIVEHIVALKKAKAQEKLEAKAKTILEQIKAAIDE